MSRSGQRRAVAVQLLRRDPAVKDFHLPTWNSTRTSFALFLDFTWLGRFISRIFISSDFYPSPIRTLIAHEFSSIFRHSHKFFTFKLVTRSKCSPFSINFHLALVQPN
uniref:(northern house mosquito) hypothetical protein n=1 Tax=Culex pipiens TaxID=7175 RepID=A0A8D8HQ79_CULPI